ncbi:hypothetical protein MMC28_005402, partial [Mycoblastus sanguinarius]|nr:hypothetical protein [Mycoblastus sanguinarius]
MSRNKGDSQVVNGGRVVKHRRWTSAHRGTWPANPDEPIDAESEPHPAAKRQKTKRAQKEKIKTPYETATSPPNSFAAGTTTTPETLPVESFLPRKATAGV